MGGNREQEVLLQRFLLQTLEKQGGSDYSCSLPGLPDKSLFTGGGLNSYFPFSLFPPLQIPICRGWLNGNAACNHNMKVFAS